MAQLNIIKHPVLTHMLAKLRDRETSNFEFSRLLHEATSLIMYEVTREMELVEATTSGTDAASKFTNVPSLVVLMRAGNGMIDGAREVLRDAPVGHIGIYRDKTVGCTVEYFMKIPDGSKENGVILLDPVIGTGDTIVASIMRLNQIGIDKITIVSVLGSKGGVAQVTEACPNARIYALEVGDGLSEDGLLEPGIGDVSGRMYNYA